MNKGVGRRRRRRGNRGRPPNPPEWIGTPLSLPQTPLSPPAASTTATNSAASNVSLRECQLPPPAGPLHLQPITRFCRIQDTRSSAAAAPSPQAFMDWRSLARVQRLLQDAPPGQREKLFWDIYTQLAEYFGQPLVPLQTPASCRSFTRLSVSPLTQVTLYDRTLSNRYAEEFEEVTVLGDGGFGHVVKARNRLDGCCYAIKIIDMEDKGNVTPDQSLQEVRALAKLNNPRVVRYHNAWLQLDLPAWSSVGASPRGSSVSDSDEDENATDRTSSDSSYDGVVINPPSHRHESHATSDNSIVFQSSGNGQRHSLRRQGSWGGSPSRAILPYCPPQAVHRPRRTLYIQMGLCGESLKEWLDQRNRSAGPVARDRCMAIFKELTEALAYIHDLGLIHRDVKPANIFFTLESQHHHIQLGDFGLAKQSIQLPTPRPGATSDLVPVLVQRNTSRVGTKLYTAPEVDRGSNYGQKSDMFSAGITLLELVSFFTTSHQRGHEIMRLREDRHLDPELRRKWPDIANLILKLTDPEPNNRPSSEELLASPLLNTFPPPQPPSPSVTTTGTPITPTAIPPDPGLTNGVLTMGEAIGGIETYHSSEVNCAGTLKLNPHKASSVLEVCRVIESSSVVNSIQRQMSEAEENVLLREENLQLKRELAELKLKLQRFSVSNTASPTLEK